MKPLPSSMPLQSFLIFKMPRVFGVARLILCLLLIASGPLMAAGGKPLLLDRLSWKGSERLPSDFLSDELGLRAGQLLSEDELTRARNRLLATGLFRSVQFFLKKSAGPGRIELEIELEDDPSVLGSWALGGNLFVHQDTRDTSQSSPNQLDPLGIKAQLISRNLFHSLHRAAVQIDSDGDGNLRGWQLAYGWPRFSAEDIQFDASLEAVDGINRYFEVLGFGGKAQLAWSLDLQEGRSLQYGVALYSNQDPRMRLPGFPKAVGGPKIGLQKETRLLSFRTSEGYAYHVASVVTGEGLRHMSFEGGGAYTKDLWSGSSLTLEADMLSIGGLSFSGRESLRWEQALPIWQNEGDPLAYLQTIYGHDHYRQTKGEGYEARIGLRFHSSGLIADLALSYSRLPDGFAAARSGESDR